MGLGARGEFSSVCILSAPSDYLNTAQHCLLSPFIDSNKSDLITASYSVWQDFILKAVGPKIPWNRNITEESGDAAWIWSFKSEAGMWGGLPM